MLDTLPPYLAGGVAGLVALYAIRCQASRRSLPLPPGPKPLPLLGNLLDIPTSMAWLTYQAWNKRYGDVVYVEALGQKIVILGSATAVNDLMEHRSSIYSDRPNPIMQNELIGLGWQITTLPYGDIWRRSRKLLHTHVHPGVLPKYRSTQLDAARRFARDILNIEQEDETLHHMIRVNIGQTILKIVYGIDINDANSEYISLADKVVDNFNEAVLPGRFLVDFLPILKYVPEWFPGAGFQRYAKEAQKNHRRLRDNTIAFVQTDMIDGTAPQSMARSMLEEDAALPSDQSHLEMIKDVTGVTYLAGSDSITVAIHSYFLAMLIWPDIQTKAQAEVDRIVGKDRLPVVDDAPQMPYVQGVVNECLRWIPVVPMSIPHATTRDDEYKGYLIPKGAVVLGALWAILHNPEDYPDPETFNPARYLTPDGSIDPSVRDPRTACFGFGRRSCPGRHIADASVFAMISTLLATVDVVRARDAQGKEIIPKIDVTDGVMCRPKPYPWSVRPRSQYAKEMLEASLSMN